MVRPRGTDCGTDFYPGGKVEHAAYTPLLRACAEQGILCVLIHMPCNLAVFNVNGADGVLDMEKYEQYRSNFPADTLEVVIDGGCHTQFGSYGPQDGDGIPITSGKEQIRQTAEAIAAFAVQ